MKRSSLCVMMTLLTAAGAAADKPAGDPSSPAEIKPAPQPVFAAFASALAPKAEAAETYAVAGRGGWLYATGELRHLAAGTFWGKAAAEAGRAAKADRRDPLPAILHMHEQCEKLGIELILMPVPAKAVVYPEGIWDVPEGFSPDTHRLDVRHAEFYRLLRDKGVTVIDLTPRFLTARNDDAGKVHCMTDTHWSGRGVILAAKALAEQLEQRAWYADATRKKYAAETRALSIDGDLTRKGSGRTGMPEETVSLRFVTDPADNDQPMADAPYSPILILADSHGRVFEAGGDMHARGAGLSSQLAYETGIAPTTLAVNGSAATPARIQLYRDAKRDPKMLEAKKVLIWCFTVREFTEATSGWARIPLRR